MASTGTIRRGRRVAPAVIPAGVRVPAAVTGISAGDARRLVRELQRQQVKLEEQNRKLLRTQAELAESRDRFNYLYDYAPAGYLTVRTDGRIHEANLRAARMLGLARAQLVNQNIFKFVAAESRDRFLAHRAEVFSATSPMTCELSLTRADGTLLPVQFQCCTFVNPASGWKLCHAILMDITERRRAEERVQHSTLQLQALSQRLVESQESERRLIARELHDQVGQSITAVQIHLQSALAVATGPEGRERLVESLRLLEDLVRQTHDLSLILRPSLLDDLGLGAALRWLLDRQLAHSTIRSRFEVDRLDHRLEWSIETNCFRIAQEALTNVVRHAQASRVSLRLLRRKTELVLVIRDNGRGFDVAATRRAPAGRSGLGLLGMEERVTLSGGSLKLRSATGRGTVVEARFPLQWRRAAAP